MTIVDGFANTPLLMGLFSWRLTHAVIKKIAAKAIIFFNTVLFFLVNKIPGHSL
jgi:hypothetical protein